MAYKKQVRAITINIQKVFGRVGQPCTVDVVVDMITDLPGYEQSVEKFSKVVDVDAIIEQAVAALPERLARDGAFEVSFAEEPEVLPETPPPVEPLPSAEELAG